MRLSRIAAIGLSVVSLAASKPPAFRPDSQNLPPAVATAVAESARAMAPDVTLDAPAPHRLGGDPAVAGIVRTLPSPIEVPSTAPTTASLRALAGAPSVVAVRSIGASRVRLHLTKVSLPPDAMLSVTGSGGDAVAFGRELLGPNGDLWTPSVEGETAAVTAPAGARFAVSEAAHFYLAPGPEGTSCAVDATCGTFSDRDTLSKAVAQITYIDGKFAYACTGGLINDAADSDRLFLTANHCISTQDQATTLEAAWDLRTTTCGGKAGTPTRTSGSTLLVTSAASDVTLLRLNSVPAGRWFLGWDTADVPAGTTLYRISHPVDSTLGLLPQVYSTTTVNTTSSVCGSRPRPYYIYSDHAIGGTGGGSSGSPVIKAGGYIVGQLFGICGIDPLDDCLTTTRVVDGAMRQSYTVLQPYIDPKQSSQCSTCTPSAGTACALGGRFKITVSWRDTAAALQGNGTIVKYADNLPEVDPAFGPVSESVFFSFYTNAPKSIELLVRMLNGHGINDKYWVFVMGFTGSEYTVTVQDTRNCNTWTRTIPANSTTVTKDFNAFPLP